MLALLLGRFVRGENRFVDLNLSEIAYLFIRILVDVYMLVMAIVLYPFIFIARMTERIFFPIKKRHFKSVLITGASAGLGKALALRYAKPGTVLFLTSSKPGNLDQVMEDCRSKGCDEVYPGYINVRDKEAMKEFVNFALATRPLDLMIANAGITATNCGLRDSIDVLDTNVMGVLHTIVPALDYLMQLPDQERARLKPQVVIMSSLGGWIPSRTLYMAPYSASKIAIRSLAISLREALRVENIGVTTFCPGFTESRMVDLQISQGIPSKGIMPMGITKINDALDIMEDAISQNKAEAAWPTGYYTLARIFSTLPYWFTELFGFIFVLTDPYHDIDTDNRFRSFGKFRTQQVPQNGAVPRGNKKKKKASLSPRDSKTN